MASDCHGGKRSGIIVATKNVAVNAVNTGAISAFVSQNTLTTQSDTLSAITLGVKNITGGAGADTVAMQVPYADPIVLDLDGSGIALTAYPSRMTCSQKRSCLRTYLLGSKAKTHLKTAKSCSKRTPRRPKKPNQTQKRVFLGKKVARVACLYARAAMK